MRICGEGSISTMEYQPAKIQGSYILTCPTAIHQGVDCACVPGEGGHLTIGKYHHIFSGAGACVYFEASITGGDSGLHI